MSGDPSTEGRSPLRRLLDAVLHRRVPVIRQTDASACGPTCLAMVLAHHGRRVPLSELLEQVGSGRDGTTAHDLARAARSHGLLVNAYSAEPRHLDRLPLPAVAHWNFNHFVVVERCGRRGVEIVDPSGGRRRLPREELDRAFTGVVLTFQPSPRFERRRGGGGHPWRRYLSSLLGQRGVRGALVQVALATLLLQLFGLAVPLATKLVVDRMLPADLGNLLPLLALGIAVWTAALTATTLLRSTLLIQLQGRLDGRMMVGFLSHLLTLPHAFFERRTVGDLAMRLSSNSMIRELVTGRSVSLLLDVGFATGYLVLLFAVSPPFGALALGLAVGQLALILVTTRPMHELMQRELEADAEQQGYLVETLEGVTTLKAAGAEERALERWSKLFFSHLGAALRRLRFSAVVESATSGLQTLAPLALLWLGTSLVLAGRLSVGSMLALVALAGSFLAPLASLVGTVRQLQTAGARLERITEVLEQQPEQDARGRRSAPRLRGEIEVEGISFRYREGGPLVLDGVSFHLRPGSKLGLVGRSGSGKSTLAALLLGLYRPERGRILYDGLDLHALDYRTVRHQVGAVLQNTALFGGSIRSNVAFLEPDAAFDRVVEAARFAALHDEVEAMPMGYETLLSEGGGALSGGQRQRLALARAVCPRPAVLILDEATSHLDSATESRVARNLSALAVTRVVIAHRLSTVRDADQILVLDEGRVVERGTHGELVAAGGLYADMVAAQQDEANRFPIFGPTAAGRS